ncbi:hypothetical protein BXZ70DRAFT_938370 [Cristinia sonorae]|uniref:Uncharacterized protein n=1 Tax=Cristinia sonorae TaxID=1940300 RepID=A0A8K0UPP1_9AGAR|nr:hypothetical protein BXZ70DRAFT_938370 [Cristinia sonorae]
MAMGFSSHASVFRASFTLADFHELNERSSQYLVIYHICVAALRSLHSYHTQLGYLPFNLDASPLEPLLCPIMTSEHTLSSNEASSGSPQVDEVADRNLVPEVNTPTNSTTGNDVPPAISTSVSGTSSTPSEGTSDNKLVSFFTRFRTRARGSLSVASNKILPNLAATTSTAVPAEPTAEPISTAESTSDPSAPIPKKEKSMRKKKDSVNK